MMVHFGRPPKNGWMSHFIIKGNVPFVMCYIVCYDNIFLTTLTADIWGCSDCAREWLHTESTGQPYTELDWF